MTQTPVLRSSRRGFLAALAAATAACRVSTGKTTPAQPQTVAPPPAQLDAPVGEITEATFAEAEKLAGVQFTPTERRQMLATVEDQIARAVNRRAHALPRDLAPATIFDPRLPGVSIPTRSPAIRPGRRESTMPTRDEDIAFAPAADLAHWISRRNITSERVTELYLDRLDTIGRTLECVVTTTPAVAAEQARQADRDVARGKPRGPLHGVPWGAKDLFDTAGVATTWGATPFASRVADEDAVVVRRLEEAGAVLVAKLTTGALAYGEIWFDGRTRSPWNPAEGSSGSSAGPAAAVAAGLVGFGLATETLGSIVSPSMRCGTTGLRPTFGRVARTGSMPLCWSLDKIGAMSRTVEDSALVLGAIDGADPGDPASLSMPYRFDARASIDGLRVGYAPQWFEADDITSVDRAALQALRGLPVELVPIEVPELPYDALLTILFAEAATTFEDLTLGDLDDQLVWQGPTAWPNTFRLSRFITAIDLLAAQRLRRQAMQLWNDIFADVDVLFGPSYADPMLLLTNCTGHPCVCLPAGFVTRPPVPFPDGMVPNDLTPREVPRGVTLWGRLFDEGTLCRVAMALESALDVWKRRPPV
jgi:Asp-tRNA(Asn)/Glu-tRNA(Gln) amidotransferase A subunit family amidase